MPIRFVGLVLTGSIMSIFISIYSCGHDFEKNGPVKRNTCRGKLFWTVYHFGDAAFAFFQGTQSSKIVEHNDIDYSEYLGPNYDKATDVHCSTIISNHTSQLDPVIQLKLIQPAFCADIGFKKMPLFNTLMNAIDTIYIPRGGSDEARKKVLEVI